MDDTSSQILNLSRKLAQEHTSDPHRGALLAQLAFVNQIFEGIEAVCEKQSWLSAEALLRTLFEASSNGIILAKHPEKLGDFIENGRMTELRIVRAIETKVLKDRLTPEIKATEAEFQCLWDKFKENPWHGFRKKDSFEQGGVRAQHL